MSLYKAKVQASSIQDAWPPPVTKKILRLAMIRTEEQVRRRNIEDDFVRQKTISGKVDDVLQQKVPIELNDIFKKSDGEQKKVLMEGAPGCGKSTLALFICHQWSDRKLFQEYKLVILVRLRDSAIQTATSIADLLPRQNVTMGQDMAKEITASNGKGVLFVFDGWDELPLNKSGHKIILSVIEGTQLQESSIVITSRPTSSARLHSLVSSRIEILGFTKDELQQYFSDCLDHNTKDVESLLQRIKENPVIEGSCYLPLNASILVHLFKCGGNELPTTLYGIFSALVCNCIFRHLKKTSQQDTDEIKSLDDLPQPVDDQFQHLCEIAYKGVIDDKVIFDLGPSFNTLGLLQGVESFVVCGRSHSYNFLHLTIQELLAAIYMGSKLKASEQTKQFQLLFSNPRFSTVFQFFAAKTKLKSHGISRVVTQIAKNRGSGLLTYLLNCLFEAQDSSLCQLVAEKLKSSFYLTGTTLKPLDCLSIGYFIGNLKGFDVYLNNCSIGVDQCRSIFRLSKVYELRALQ